jgi:DNA-binding PadR family transcriptional regulator
MKNYRDRSLLHGNVETLVLALLAEKRRHGYELRQALAERSHGHFQLAFGRLYPLLWEIERRRLVTGQTEIVGERRERRCYRITAAGHRELRKRCEAWKDFVSHMSLILDRAGRNKPRT